MKQNGFCEQCGASLEAGSKFCEQCGALVPQEEEPISPSPQPALSSVPSPIAPPSSPRYATTRPSTKAQKTGLSTLWKIVIVIIVVGLLLLCGILVAVLGLGWFSLSSVSLSQNVTNLLASASIQTIAFISPNPEIPTIYY